MGMMENVSGQPAGFQLCTNCVLQSCLWHDGAEDVTRLELITYSEVSLPVLFTIVVVMLNC